MTHAHKIRVVFSMSSVCAFALVSAPAVPAQTSPVVAIVAVTCMELPDAGEIEVQGEIRNLSSQPINSMVLSAVFNGVGGQFVSTSDLPVKFDPVMPGQVSPFDGFGDYNPIIRNVTVTPAIEDGPSLPSSGNGETRCKDSKQ